MSDYAPEFREPKSPLKAITRWATTYRDMIAARSELATCGMEEAASVARDIGVSLQELEFAVQKGPHAADELPELLGALGVNAQNLSQRDLRMIRSLERTCIACPAKGECRHELAAGTAGGRYKRFCPNAWTIDGLIYANQKTGTAAGNTGLR
jgi:hypothetical protein